MSNKQAADQKLKRILQLHKCLRTGDEWSGEALAEACKTDKRTIVNDVAFMRKELKASILSSRYYGYKYAPDKPYSLLSSLDDTELGTLNELLAVVRQLQNTKELRGLERVLLALERQAGVVKGNPNPLIEFEEPTLRGREFLDKLYQYIHRKVFTKFLYKGFKMIEAEWKIVFPLQLREYNNRWYLIGWAADKNGQIVIQNFPIDRIEQEPGQTSEKFDYPQNYDLNQHFASLIGVTKTGNLQPITLKFHDDERAKYALTKQFHPNQHDEIDPSDGKIILKFEVEINNELISKIMEYTPDVEVALPPELRKQIKEKLDISLARYP